MVMVAGLVAGIVPVRFNVSPAIAPETVLVALLIGIPSTVSDAFVAGLPARVMLKVGSELLTVKSAADPVVELTSARRSPLASVTTLAFTPIPDELIAFARSDRVFTPDPVLKEVCVPSAPVIVRVDVPRFALPLGNEGEYHDALVARFWTAIRCDPMEAPAAAVPVTWVALEEAVRPASGPPMSLRLLRSFDTDESAAWSVVSAVI